MVNNTSTDTLLLQSFIQLFPVCRSCLVCLPVTLVINCCKCYFHCTTSCLSVGKLTSSHTPTHTHNRFESKAASQLFKIMLNASYNLIKLFNGVHNGQISAHQTQQAGSFSLVNNLHATHAPLVGMRFPFVVVVVVVHPTTTRCLFIKISCHRVNS